MALLTLTSTGTLGDHFPFLALGQRLVERGHTVRYAGPEYLRLHVESCGMQLHPTRREQDPSTVRNKPESFDHWLPEKGGPSDVRDRTTGVNQPELHDKLGFDEMLDDVTAACAGADLLVCSRLHLNVSLHPEPKAHQSGFEGGNVRQRQRPSSLRSR